MTHINYDVIFLRTIFSRHTRTSSVNIVHATAQSPIICKTRSLVHKQTIISANPYPILKQIADM